MQDYSQPSFYHFSQDSTSLANFIGQEFKAHKPQKILDLCAGCGVIGIEIARKLNSVNFIQFVEIQKEYELLIKKNMSFFLPELNFSIFLERLSKFKTEETFDLVCSNPPYFVQGEGRLSSNYNKQLARTFEVDCLRDLLLKMRVMRSHDGHALFVFPKRSSILDEVKSEFQIKTLLELAKVNIYSVV